MLSLSPWAPGMVSRSFLLMNRICWRKLHIIFPFQDRLLLFSYYYLTLNCNEIISFELKHTILEGSSLMRLNTSPKQLREASKGVFWLLVGRNSPSWWRRCGSRSMKQLVTWLATAIRKKGEMIVGAQLPLSTFMQSEIPAPDTIPHIFKMDRPTSDKLG